MARLTLILTLTLSLTLTLALTLTLSVTLTLIEVAPWQGARAQAELGLTLPLTPNSYP